MSASHGILVFAIIFIAFVNRFVLMRFAGCTDSKSLDLSPIVYREPSTPRLFVFTVFYTKWRATQDGGPHPALVELCNAPSGLVVGDIGRALLLHINNARAIDAERLSQVPSSQLTSVNTFTFVCHYSNSKKPLDTTTYIRRSDFMRLRDNKDSTPLRWRVCRGDPDTFVACVAAFEFGSDHNSAESSKMFESQYYALIMAILGMQDLLPTKEARFGFGASLVHELIGCIDFQFAPVRVLNQGVYLWDAEALEKELGSDRHRALDHLVPSYLYRALVDAHGVNSSMPSQQLKMPPIYRASVNFYQGNNYLRPHTSYDPPGTFCDFDFKSTPVAKRTGSRASRAPGARPPGGGDSSPRKPRGEFQSPPVVPRHHLGPRRLSLDSVPMTPVPSPNSEPETQDPKLQPPPESPLEFITASQLLHRGRSPSPVPSESAAAAAPDPPSVSFPLTSPQQPSLTFPSASASLPRPRVLECRCEHQFFGDHEPGCAVRLALRGSCPQPVIIDDYNRCVMGVPRCERLGKRCKDGEVYCEQHEAKMAEIQRRLAESDTDSDSEESEETEKKETKEKDKEAVQLDSSSSSSGSGSGSDREYDPVAAWAMDSDSKALVPVAVAEEKEEIKGDQLPRDAWRRYNHRRSANGDSDLCAALEKGQVLVAVRNFFGGDAVHRVRGRPPAGEEHLKPVTFMLLDRLFTSETGPGFSGCYITEQGLIDHDLPTEPDLSRQLLLAYRPTPGETRLSIDSNEQTDVVQWLVDEYFLEVDTPTQGPYKWNDRYYTLGAAKYNKLKSAIANGAAVAPKRKHKRKAGQAGVIMTAKRHRRC